MMPLSIKIPFGGSSKNIKQVNQSKEKIGDGQSDKGIEKKAVLEK